MKKTFNVLFLFLVIVTLCSFRTSSNIVRVLEKTNDKSITHLSNISISDNNYKNILTTVGFTNQMLTNISTKDLIEYKKAKNIYMVKSEYHENYLIKKDIVQHHMGGGGDVYPDQLVHNGEELKNDAYMNMYFVLIELPNRKLKFSVDVEWIKTPFFRMTDSLGFLSQFTAIDYSTQYGYFSYDCLLKTTTINSLISEKEYFNQENYQKCDNGEWFGVGCVINLPDDYLGKTLSKVYSNFKMHYEYYGYFNGNLENSIINATCTYSHQKIEMNLIPEISISFDPFPSIGIGFPFYKVYEYRTVRIPYSVKLSNL